MTMNVNGIVVVAQGSLRREKHHGKVHESRCSTEHSSAFSRRRNIGRDVDVCGDVQVKLEIIV